MKNGQGGRTQVHKRDDLDYWATLDAATKKSKMTSVKGKTITGDQVKTQALEWLRLESIRLAYKNCPDSFLDVAQSQDWDIRHARGSDRDRLINPPLQPITWVYPYFLRNLEKAFCFEVLHPDELHPERLSRECRSGRMIISIDPRYSTRCIEELTKLLRGKRSGKRALGAGPKFQLLRLREALLSYETWLAKAPITQQQGLGPHIYSPTLARDKIVMRDIGESLRSYPAPSGKDPYHCENIARDILGIARKMMQVAVASMSGAFPYKDESANRNATLRIPTVVPAWPRQYR